jgi:hypothetical protein
MKLKLTKIDFDLTTDDVGENDDTLQHRLRNAYVGKVFEVDDEDELADAISDSCGWCVNSLDYKKV